MQVDVDAEGRYILDTAPMTVEELSANAVYKIKLRRYVEKQLSDSILLLKEQPVAEDAERMLSKVDASISRLGYEIVFSDEILHDVAAKREHADERARVGIEIKSRDRKYQTQFDEYKSVVNNAFARPLRLRQMWDSFFMCVMGKAGNFSVPGSGKTASVLGVFAFLRAKDQASRIIVICPKNAFESWRNEFRACFGNKRVLVEFNTQDLSFKRSRHKERKRRLRMDTGGCNLILVNYEAAPTYVEELRELVSSSALLVFDEVHRVKRVKGKWAQAALDIAAVSDRTIALTGTPIPNTYLDIYNFLHILFPREYDSFFNFSKGLLRAPTSKEMVRINSKIQPFFCRTTKDDLGVPPANPDDLQAIYVDSRTELIFDVLKMRYRKNKLTLMLRVMQLQTQPSMLLESLDPAEYSWLLSEDEETGEIDYMDYSAEIQNMIVNAPPSAKVKHCIDLVARLKDEGKPTIIWCVLVNSMQLLEAKIKQLGLNVAIVYGNTAQSDREAILNEFRSGQIDVLLTNPHTLAESVSLHSICHDAIYYEYSFNLVHLLQSKDRIHRLGLPDGQYTQYYFLQDVYDNFNNGFSLDMNIYARLMEKEQRMMKAIADGKLEMMPTSSEDLEVVFQGLFDQ